MFVHSLLNKYGKRLRRRRASSVPLPPQQHFHPSNAYLKAGPKWYSDIEIEDMESWYCSTFMQAGHLQTSGWISYLLENIFQSSIQHSLMPLHSKQGSIQLSWCWAQLARLPYHHPSPFPCSASFRGMAYWAIHKARYRFLHLAARYRSLPLAYQVNYQLSIIPAQGRNKDIHVTPFRPAPYQCECPLTYILSGADDTGTTGSTHVRQSSAKLTWWARVWSSTAACGGWGTCSIEDFKPGPQTTFHKQAQLLRCTCTAAHDCGLASLHPRQLSSDLVAHCWVTAEAMMISLCWQHYKAEPCLHNNGQALVGNGLY
jgi:hypothetical protein